MQDPVAVISLKTIARNAEILSAAVKKPFIAVVKDDAYGHGAEAVALALQRSACAFAVSTAKEGAALRTAGITRDILVLTPPLSAEDALCMAAYRLTASITSFSALHLLESVEWGEKIQAHIAVNTGMNRYGVRPEHAYRAAREAEQSGIEVTGVYSHLYAPQDGDALRAQAECFGRVSRAVRLVFPGALRHLSATGGALAGVGFDAVRLGIALYGYLPEGFERALPVRPALRLYAPVAHGGTFTGGGVGYAKANKRYQKLHTLRLGYGDGLFRSGGLGSIGNLCMDACIREGRADFGGRRLVLKDMSEYAREHGTTEYETLVRLAGRVERVYV